MKPLLVILIGLGLTFSLCGQEATFFERIHISPEHPAPGELFRIYAVSDPHLQALSMQVQDSRHTTIQHFKAYLRDYGPVKYWIIAGVVPASSTETSVHLIFKETRAIQDKNSFLDLDLADHAFHSETIEFGLHMSNLKTVPDPQKTKESMELSNILMRFDDNFWIDTAGFSLPLESLRNTSFFGDRRIYAYSNGKTEKTLHNGIDFGGNRLAVYASAPGLVVFSGRRIVTGNTVVIQHAPGLFSLHYHLSSLKVHLGQVLVSRALIGLTGATGLVTGPHLHWEFRNQGEAIDPEAFVAHEHIDTGTLSTILSLPLLP